MSESTIVKPFLWKGDAPFGLFGLEQLVPLSGCLPQAQGRTPTPVGCVGWNCDLWSPRREPQTATNIFLLLPSPQVRMDVIVDWHENGYANMSVQSMARASVAQAMGWWNLAQGTRSFGVYFCRKEIYVRSTRCRENLLNYSVVQGPVLFCSTLSCYYSCM